MSKPRFGRIFQRRPDGPWWIAYYDGNNREHRESTKSNKRGDAEQLLKRRHAEVLAGMGKIATPPEVNILLDDLLADYTINAKSSQWVKLVNDTHLRPFFGTMRSDHVTTKTINTYILKRREKGIANATINRELSLLRRAFRLAALQDPPLVAKVPRFPKLAEHNVRTGFFEQEDLQRLLPHLPEHLSPIVLFAYHTGCRRGEILSLRWESVHLAENFVRLEPGTTKNREARTIPLTDELTNTLRALKKQRDKEHPSCAYVFHYRGEQMHSLKTGWANACKAAKLTTKDGKPRFLFHDLRRTAVRNLVRAGVPETVASKISGHKTRAIFDRYNITSTTDLTKAMEQLTTYLRSKKRSDKK